MKKLVLVVLAVALTAGLCLADSQQFVSLNNISKYTVSAATPAKNAHKVSGYVILKSNATCSVFLNATTLTRTAAATGYPLTVNVDTPLNIPKTSSLTFTCATSAGNRAVYILR